jgi:hypothetical protein
VDNALNYKHDFTVNCQRDATDYLSTATLSNDSCNNDQTDGGTLEQIQEHLQSTEQAYITTQQHIFMEHLTKNTPPHIEDQHQNILSEQRKDCTPVQQVKQDNTDEFTNEQQQEIEEFAYLITTKTEQKALNEPPMKTYIREKYPFPIYLRHTTTPGIQIAGKEERQQQCNMSAMK